MDSRLTTKEIHLILDALREKHGPGYAPGDVGRLQAKLSILLEIAAKRESL